MIKHRLVRLLIHEGSAEEVFRAKQQREVKQYKEVFDQLHYGKATI